MAINVTINISEQSAVPVAPSHAADRGPSDWRELFGDDIAPFPGAGIDGFLSHFVFAIRPRVGPLRGQLIVLTMEPAVQTVARSDPFLFRAEQVDHVANLAMPTGTDLKHSVSISDFLVRPAGFFTPGKEQVWLQILNLDAKGDSKIGPIRFLLGESLKKEYPDVFQPSLGAVQSLGPSGLPARLFFSPIAVLETNFGAFKTRPKALEARRIVSFPPIGGVQITELIPLDSVEALRAAGGAQIPEPAVELVALAHPIDAVLHLPGEEAFRTVQQSITGSKSSP